MLYLLAALLFSNSASADDACELKFAQISNIVAHKTEGFLPFNYGRKVFYREMHVENPKGRIVLLNGLNVQLSAWDSYVKRLNSEGYSVVQMAFSGQPESLVGTLGKAPKFLEQKISPAMLTEEVEAVVKATAGESPLHIETYSFGAMAGVHYAHKHPETVASLTMITPLVQALDKYIPAAKQANAAFDQMKANSAFFDPFGLFGATKNIEVLQENAYRRTVEESLQKYQGGRDYIEGVEPSTFRAGITQLVIGAKDFNLSNFSSQKLPRVNIILTENEFYAKMKEDQIAFWKSLPESSRGNLVEYDDFGHNDILGNAEAASEATTRLLIENKGPGGKFLKLDTKSGKLKAQ